MNTRRNHSSVAMRAMLGLAALALAGCPNPVQDREIEALGGECSDIPEGEFHRPGQPCVLCHGEYERDSPIMSIGGTVFATKSSPTPVEGVEILLTDANGTMPPGPILTNCIGNFFIESDAWTPAFPLHAEIVCPNPDNADEPRRLVMGTRVTRDGSCAGCHIDKPGDHLDSPGWIYCAPTSPMNPYVVRDTCQGRSQDPQCPTAGF